MKYFLIFFVLIGLMASHAFGSENLPSSQDYPFEKLTGATCDGKATLCYGTFVNGTTIPVQCDYFIHGCGAIPSDYVVSLLSPLKQFKTEIPFDDIECKETLVLVQKYNGSPACVNQETVSKLMQRGWILPKLKPESELASAMPGLEFKSQLTVEGLNQTYTVGQKIEFTIKFDGIWHGCGVPRLKIEDANHQQIWEGGLVVSLCDPDMKRDHIKKEWIVNDDSNLGVPVIDKEGFYTLFVSFGDDAIQRDFVINTSPILETNSNFNLQKIYNKFPNVAQRQAVMQIKDLQSQDGALGVTVIDKITREKPSDDVMYLEIIKQWDEFKVPESMFFNITLEGDDTPTSKPFLIQQSLMESHVGPLKDQFYFSLPINVPLYAKAKQGAILFNYTMYDILPKDDKYHLKFASFSDVKVELPNDATIIQNNTQEYSEFWSYDENYTLTHKSNHLTLSYPSNSFDVNSVIIYDITFEIRK